MSSAEHPVRTERRGAVALVLLNRPGALNAINGALREGLIAALGTLNADPAVYAVVITGAGDRAFCAGQDLDEAMRYRIEDIDEWLTRQHAMYQSIRDLDKPCIAALNGTAAGAGFQVGLCADLRIGFPEMKLGQPEIRAGLASIVGSYLMTLHLGLGRNVELSLGGELVTGARAFELGLVNELVPREIVLDRALSRADALAKLAPTAVRLTKRRFRELTQPGFDAALAAAKSAQKEAYASGEPQEAMARFFRDREARGRGGT